MSIIATHLKLKDKEYFGLYYEVSGLVRMIYLLTLVICLYTYCLLYSFIS